MTFDLGGISVEKVTAVPSSTTKEDWKNVDFHALKKQHFGKMEDQIAAVKQD